jgi:hypothetical protein
LGKHVQQTTIGDLINLQTTDKSNIVAAINEVQASAGKTKVNSYVWTATANQTLFTIPTGNYVPNKGNIEIHVGGKTLISGIDYTETSPTSFTLLTITDLEAGDIVYAKWFEQVNLVAGSTVVEDVLTSSSSANALSANQGKVLNNKIGILSNLNTSAKADVVSAINEVNTKNQTKVNQQYWTATTGQTVFNITSPGNYLINKGNIQVFIGGIALVSGVDYIETSSTSFTLTNTDLDGEVVFAKWFEQVSVVAGSTVVEDVLTSTSNLNALSANQGRVLSSQLAESVHLKNFASSVVNNDWQPAILAIINKFQGNVTINVDKYTFPCSNFEITYPNVSFIGTGTIQQITADSTFITVNADNVKFIGVNLKGNLVNGDSTTSKGVFLKKGNFTMNTCSVDSFGYGLRSESKTDNVTISNNSFSNVRQGISFGATTDNTYSTNVKIADNTIICSKGSLSSSRPIVLWSVTKYTIKGNTLLGGGMAIESFPTTSAGNTESTADDRIISNNTADTTFSVFNAIVNSNVIDGSLIPAGRGYQSNYTCAIEVYIQAIVTNNKILNAPKGGIYHGSGNTSVYIGSSVISNNVFYHNGYTDNQYGDIYLTKSENVIISDNQFKDSNNDGITLNKNMAGGTPNCKNILINGNMFANQYKAAINVTMSDYVVIKNNLFRNTNTRTDSNGYGPVYIYNSVTNVELTGNTIINDSAIQYLTAMAQLQNIVGSNVYIFNNVGSGLTKVFQKVGTFDDTTIVIKASNYINGVLQP